MSLLYCRMEPVEHPYFIEVLGIHVFSSQELCYVIFNNPLLVMEDFVDDGLLSFIRKDLDMALVADRMQKLLETGSRAEEVLLLFMSECDYYSEKELGRFKAAVTGYRRLKAEEYEKQRADYLFGRRQYGRAAVRYERILDGASEDGTSKKELGEEFLAGVYSNLGAAYAQMFQFQKALNAYEKAYGIEAGEDVLKRIYFLGRFAPELEIKGQCKAGFTQERVDRWEQEFAQAKLDAEQAEEVRSLRALFHKDPVKRMSGAVQMVQRWKAEYRQMV